MKSPDTAGGETFGEVIKGGRERAGFSLSQAAKNTGMTKSFLWEVEDGRTRISFDRVVKLCRLYALDIRELARVTP